MNVPNIQVEQVVFLCKTEEHWDKPFTMKRHHVPDTRSVVLRAKVVEIRGNEFMAELQGNNGFERDGEQYVFHKNTLLVNQDFTNTDSLGKWK